MSDGLLSTSVLDASAVLALVYAEPGDELVRSSLRGAVISTVNWTEVMQKCLVDGRDVSFLRANLEIAGTRVLPFALQEAELAARLRLETRRLGLSLGDRACLALGITSSLPVITADRAWGSLSLPVEVRLIR